MKKSSGKDPEIEGNPKDKTPLDMSTVKSAILSIKTIVISLT